jgi:hypothetical protein
MERERERGEDRNNTVGFMVGLINYQTTNRMSAAVLKSFNTERSLRMFENRVLRRIFGAKRGEVEKAA